MGADILLVAALLDLVPWDAGDFAVREWLAAATDVLVEYARSPVSVDRHVVALLRAVVEVLSIVDISPRNSPSL